jgi:flagellar basal-body rod protein FlgF
MENTLYIAVSYQSALQNQMDTIANNLANVSTPGFKNEQILFSEYLSQAIAADDVSFVQDIGVARDLREGAFTKTSNPLDVAVSGSGWLVVDTPNGLRYTRNGHMAMSPQGRLVTTAGNPILDENDRPITLPPGASSIIIGADGTVSADRQTVGRLKLVKFDNEQLLRAEGDSLYTTDAPAAPASGARIVQGMVEESNTKPIVEITNMISALREFQAAQQIIEQEHQLQLQAINTLTTTTTA